MFAIAVVLTSLFFAAPAYSASGLKGQLMRCARVKDDAARLACFDKAAKNNGLTTQSEVHRAKGNWVVRTETSPIDDSQNVYVRLKANKSISGWLESYTPWLVLQCKQNTTDVYVITGMQAALGRLGEYGTEFHDATLRFDKAAAKNIEMTGSTDGKALFFRDAIRTAKSMMHHQRLLFEFTPFHANPTMTTFDIGGLSEAIKPLRKACHW